MKIRYEIATESSVQYFLEYAEIMIKNGWDFIVENGKVFIEKPINLQ